MKPTVKELQQKIAGLEQALANRSQEQEAIYKTLIESLPLAIAIYDGKGRFLYANQKTEQLFHLPEGSMTGKTFHQIFPKETADDQMKVMRQIFKTGQPYASERIINWHGQIININVTRQPLFDDRGKVTSVLAIGEDITGHKRQLKMLDIQHQIDSLSNMSANLNTSLKKAFEHLMQIDWVDGGGIYLFDNDQKNLMLVFSVGLSEDYISHVSVFSSNDPPAKVVLKGKSRYVNTRAFLEPIKNIMIREKLTYAVSIPLIFKKQVIGSLNLGSRTVEDVNQSDRMIVESISTRLANLIMLVKTREELFSLNQKLNLSLHEIEEQQQLLIQKSRLESLGELSAGLAHEINQPLSVISLVMENITYKLEQNAASGEYLAGKFSTITQNVDKIRQLIDHVRIFSRDQGSIMVEQVDVNQVISNAFLMIESQLKNFHIKVSADLSENLGYTLGNPSRLEQVILNLLSNSKDALAEKEKKNMPGDRSKEIRITTSNEKDRIIARFWDNGTGISAGNLDKIFNPFFTTKTDDRGTGLGLAIVYGIITEMKGKITARSTPGEFTEITITLPGYKKMLKKNDNL